MRIIAFINEGPVIGEIFGHLGEPISAPHLAPARGPPLWELTTSSTSASLGRREKDKGHGLSRDDSCLKAEDRPNSAGLLLSGERSAWASRLQRGFRRQFSFEMGRKAPRYLPWER
jgi:hypothetical protein